MTDKTYKEMASNSYLGAENSDYIDALYETYLKDPSLLSDAWQAYFEQVAPSSDVSHADIRTRFAQLAKQKSHAGASVSSQDALEVLAIYRLIEAYRTSGHYHAKLDPLNLKEPLPAPELALETYGLSASTAVPAQLISEFSVQTVGELQKTLQAIYCNTLGVEYKHIRNAEEIKWFQKRLESQKGQYAFSAKEKTRILQQLSVAEGFEKYLANKFVGQTRFGLEGGETFIPWLKEIMKRGAEQGVKKCLIAMAHRGRLNTLVNVVGHPAKPFMDQYSGIYPENGYSGDVKYHIGYSSEVRENGQSMKVNLACNPSHLEIISPVVEGVARAKQDRLGEEGKAQILPILVHGDAAVIGQGIVMENYSMSQTRGFDTGGSLHIVLNNQVGFTTSLPKDARSSYYCTDVAKMIDVPILHVNGDDPEAVVFTAQLALDYRMKFKKDVVVDLVCYRRSGHNEGDEPSATQPIMYQHIKAHATPRQLYADKLIAEKNCTAEEAQAMLDEYREKLDKNEPLLDVTPADPKKSRWKKYNNTDDWRKPVESNLSEDILRGLAAQLDKLPEGFTPQAQVGKILDDRRKMTAKELPINWGYAEIMAYASLLKQGYSIRLVGEDCGRGTFAHRHAVLHDYKNGKVYTPLKQLYNTHEKLTIVDSLLSEEAVLGFEYGYSTTDPETLVIWEAQYGDFWNGAEIVVDQFITSGEQKWEQLSGLVMLLPHGYEGAGPEHSSARIERFLQMAAENNIQVCVPSTPAQIFHVLRQQMLRTLRRPLIIMTPKSFLRHKLAISSWQELSSGQFHPVIPDADVKDAKKTERVIFCSGKVYYDLHEEREKRKNKTYALVRLEQLYPFPDQEVATILKHYSNVSDIVWCQEEPKNQGAWSGIQESLRDALGSKQKLRYVGRPAAASPSTGYSKIHQKEQAVLVGEALSEK